MNRKALSIIVGIALSLNVSMSTGVPVADGVQIGTSFQHLLEYLKEYKDQIDTWKEQADRHINQITGIKAKDILGKMGVDLKAFEKLDNDLKNVLGIEPEKILKEIVSKGFDGFPNKVKAGALAKYTTTSSPKNLSDLALNRVGEYCASRDATVEMMKLLDEGAKDTRKENSKKAVQTTSDTISGGSSKSDTGGTTSVAAGVTASAVVADSASSTANTIFSEEKEKLKLLYNQYSLLCKEAMADYGSLESNVGLAIGSKSLSISGKSDDGSSSPRGSGDARF